MTPRPAPVAARCSTSAPSSPTTSSPARSSPTCPARLALPRLRRAPASSQTLRSRRRKTPNNEQRASENPMFIAECPHFVRNVPRFALATCPASPLRRAPLRPCAVRARKETRQRPRDSSRRPPMAMPSVIRCASSSSAECSVGRNVTRRPSIAGQGGPDRRRLVGRSRCRDKLARSKNARVARASAGLQVRLDESLRRLRIEAALANGTRETDELLLK